MLTKAENKRISDLEEEVDEMKEYMLKHFVTPQDENKGVMKRREKK